MPHQAEGEHAPAQCRRDLEDCVTRLQTDAFDVRGIGREHVHPDRRREQEDRLRAHARHYSTPSRFTAR